MHGVQPTYHRIQALPNKTGTPLRVYGQRICQNMGVDNWEANFAMGHEPHNYFR